MTVLVTGGAGYVGSHIVNYLLKHNLNVVVIDNLSTGHRQAVNSHARFYYGDIRNVSFLNRIFDKESIEVVIHLAAFSIVSKSMKNPLRYFDNNVNGFISLLKVMQKHQVKRIVFSSSASVYGIPKEVPIKETTACHPINPYGESKLIMENIAHWTQQAYGIQFVALRYFNVAGADLDGKIGEDHCPETHLIPIILKVALGKQKQLKIFGNNYPTRDGTNVRDYIHVVDLAKAHYLAMYWLLKDKPSEIFNLGSATGYSNYEMLYAARKITGRQIPAIDAPRRLGDPSVLIADPTKAKRILGWQPQYDDLIHIIGSAWNWMKNHPSGYSK